MIDLALRRSINVVGKKSITMAKLVKLFESLKFKNVQKYIQSGNVVLEAASSNTTTLLSRSQRQFVFKGKEDYLYCPKGMAKQNPRYRQTLKRKSMPSLGRENRKQRRCL
jgi:hypothetical protein